MKRHHYSVAFLAAAWAWSACSNTQQPTAIQQTAVIEPAQTAADRDALYDKLTEEEKRLPENAVLGLEAAEGLEVKLFASEPMMGNPTNIDVDAKGRVWVCEAYNYRPELNPNNPQRKEGDRILILEDQNADGRADTAKVFYQGTDINSALGVAVLGDKVIVSSSPNVFLFTDTDGDDVADKKEVLYTGLGGEQHDHAIHSFTFGPDGKLYFNFGNEGKQILDRNGKPIVDKDGKVVNNSGKPYRQGMIFRVNPDGTEFEVLAHNFRNNYEAAVDSYGTLWQSDNDDDGNQGVRINYVMEFGNYGYTDEMTGAGWRARRTNMEKEIPKQHWHQNDPGSIPNLLQTGAGSPTGMVVYEGELLPEGYRNQMIHTDAGPNTVRAYPVTKDGAGYKAEVVPLVEGVRDQWFRPSDLSVAPDGSIYVADWYDPGVGGHQMADLNRGRIFRIAPPATPYKTPKLDLSSPEGAVKALQSPNLATRYLAWDKLNTWGEKAEPALQALWKSDHERYRARALWLLAKIEGKSDQYIREALQDENPDIRITGLRIARQEKENVIPYVKQLVKDPSPQVRREAAIALRHNKSAEAPALWAELAQQYDGQDRWYLEALGIGADEQWDKFLVAYQGKVGKDLTSKANRDIVWRSRTGLALPYLAQYISDANATSADIAKYFRAFDFIQDPAKEGILLALLENQGPHKQEVKQIALNHINPAILPKTPKLKAALDETLIAMKGTQEFVDLVGRYKLKNQNEELLNITVAYPDSSIGVASARLLFDMGGAGLLKKAVTSKDKDRSAAVLRALGRINSNESMDLIQEVVMDKAADMDTRKVAVKALGTGWNGEERLMHVVKEGKLPKEMEPAASSALAGAMRTAIRDEALKYLNVANATGGKPLPPIGELVMRSGDVLKGKQVYQQVCSTCHQVGSEGSNFGPALTQIGSKLTKDALYVSIIHPDAGISFGYEGYLIKLKDGSGTAGIISSETENEIEVVSPGGIKNRYDKSAVASKTQMENSFMPSNLQQAMSEQDLVDLVEYMYSLKKPTEKGSASR
ncbi:putative membrane-bound dehydrogenase-like protein [Pontibacter ummariensis]|uniref:Putative membrane-bound dehydrogenase domain-containing protein n=1 Tax=Pontibacter ummariensis TaxID=1610492 RepID=A0A239DKF3_9BACT|nr:PVC-type heme-binding CxxCH protein [Pontibacter ummariensis]PRY13881.1 putative membrane-bound dehydrogenase-like protein [Pontibacter ummariensis]SNS32897.1 putative membrane-bound dehydrogenase domain-containing protein [Pontibacter ummariensis]